MAAASPNPEPRPMRIARPEDLQTEEDIEQFFADALGMTVDEMHRTFDE